MPPPTTIAQSCHNTVNAGALCTPWRRTAFPPERRSGLKFAGSGGSRTHTLKTLGWLAWIHIKSTKMWIEIIDVLPGFQRTILKSTCNTISRCKFFSLNFKTSCQRSLKTRKKVAYLGLGLGSKGTWGLWLYFFLFWLISQTIYWPWGQRDFNPGLGTRHSWHQPACEQIDSARTSQRYCLGVGI